MLVLVAVTDWDLRAAALMAAHRLGRRGAAVRPAELMDTVSRFGSVGLDLDIVVLAAAEPDTPAIVRMLGDQIPPIAAVVIGDGSPIRSRCEVRHIAAQSSTEELMAAIAGLPIRADLAGVDVSAIDTDSHR